MDVPNGGLTLTAPPRATLDAAKDQAEQAAEAQQAAAMQMFDIPVPWTTTVREMIEELNSNQQGWNSEQIFTPTQSAKGST